MKAPEFIDIFLGLISVFLGILTTHTIMKLVAKDACVGYPKWVRWATIITCDIIFSPIIILVCWFGLAMILYILSGFPQN